MSTLLEPTPIKPPEEVVAAQKVMRTVFTNTVVMDVDQIVGFTTNGMVIAGGTLIPLVGEELTNVLYVWQVSRGARPDQPIIGMLDGAFKTLTSIPVDGADAVELDGAPPIGVIEVEATPITE